MAGDCRIAFDSLFRPLLPRRGAAAVALALAACLLASPPAAALDIRAAEAAVARVGATPAAPVADAVMARADPESDDAGDGDATSRPEAGRARATGRLEGRVMIGPQISSKRIRFDLYPEMASTAPAAAVAPEADELRNVVVWFEPSPKLRDDGITATERPATHSARAAAATDRPVMRQEGLTFRPHVLPVVRGTSVEFPNADPIFHNVFSLSRAASFDLGRYPRGASRSVRFDTPGMVKVFCHIHSDMSAMVVVLDNPYFAVPDRDGRYAIDGIPPGEYRVTAWHERARPLSRTVRIRPGEAARIDFSIPLTESTGGE